MIDFVAMELTDPRFSSLPKPFRLEALLDGVAAAATPATTS